MRKIDDQMAQAFATLTPFKSGNSEVKVIKQPDGLYTAEAYLHGNRIAFIDAADGFKSKGGYANIASLPDQHHPKPPSGTGIRRAQATRETAFGRQGGVT